MALRYVGSEPTLLVSFSRPPASAVRDALRLSEVGRLGETTVFTVGVGPFEALAILHDLLAADAGIRSAAFVPGMPDPGSLWIVIEWKGQLVVHRGLLDRLGHHLEGWDFVSEHREEQLVILEPGRVVEERPAERLSPDLDKLQRQLDELYGELAHPSLGGAVAIAATFGAVPRDLNAVGIEVERAADAPPALVKSGAIEIVAYGGRSADDITLAQGDEGGVSPDVIAEALDSADASCFALARISAAVDPPVRFPRGYILEQERLNTTQNLALVEARVVDVPAGGHVVAVLPAFCLNVDRSWPSGEPMRPTALRIDVPSDITQEDVWRVVDERRARV
jgi:hypothetical protein